MFCVEGLAAAETVEAIATADNAPDRRSKLPPPSCTLTDMPRPPRRPGSSPSGIRRSAGPPTWVREDSDPSPARGNVTPCHAGTPVGLGRELRHATGTPSPLPYLLPGRFFKFACCDLLAPWFNRDPKSMICGPRAALGSLVPAGSKPITSFYIVYCDCAIRTDTVPA